MRGTIGYDDARVEMQHARNTTVLQVQIPCFFDGPVTLDQAV
jgi:hypothetical protein